MRVVTGYARFHRIMGDWIDLRETGWFGRTVAVAKYAVISITGSRQHAVAHALNMFLARTMTSFTIHRTMVGVLLNLIDVTVTVQAGGVPGIVDWQSRN